MYNIYIYDSLTNNSVTWSAVLFLPQPLHILASFHYKKTPTDTIFSTIELLTFLEQEQIILCSTTVLIKDIFKRTCQSECIISLIVQFQTFS